jgi:hypothetical protein
MECAKCGAENSESNRYCGNCGQVLANHVRIRENFADGRYGPANPEYPDLYEEIYVVWKWPYNLWGISMQTRSSYMIQNSLIWIFHFFVMLGLILNFGLTALVVVLILTTFLGIMQYVSWKAGRSAAEELHRTK